MTLKKVSNNSYYQTMSVADPVFTCQTLQKLAKMGRPISPL